MQKNRLPIIGLIVFGLLALGLTAMTLLGGNRTATPNQPVVQVSATPTPGPVTKQVVAQTNIPPRTIITRSMLRLEDTSSPQPGTFSNMSDVVGRLASAPINAGQGVGSEMVTLPIRRMIPADFEIPTGLRAVAIYVDPSQTAAGLVDKGDRVDVIASYKTSFDKQDTEFYTQVYAGRKDYTIGRTIAQDLLVLGVDASLLAPPQTPTPAANATGTIGSAAPAAATPTPTPGVGPARIRVLLAATPAMCERLVAANDAGTLHLTIRNPNSREQSALGEAREYPIRITNVRKKQPEQMKQATEGLKNFASGMSDLRDVVQNNPKLPSVTAPLAVPSSGPSLPGGSQVTVVRGTDKTNVTVPLSP